MGKSTMDHNDLAAFIAEHTEKENIIPAVFVFFSLDCMERCNVNSSYLDELIRQFESSKECDIKLLAAIIEEIRVGKKNTKKKENELIY